MINIEIKEESVLVDSDTRVKELVFEEGQDVTSEALMEFLVKYIEANPNEITLSEKKETENDLYNFIYSVFETFKSSYNNQYAELETKVRNKTNELKGNINSVLN